MYHTPRGSAKKRQNRWIITPPARAARPSPAATNRFLPTASHVAPRSGGPPRHRRSAKENAPARRPCNSDLERSLARQSLPFAKVNPRQARRFAEAIGQVAKTDRVDATVLARMGAALQLEATAALPEHMAELRALLVFRRGLVKDRTAAQARLKTARSPLLRRLLAQRLAQIARQVARVDGEMQAIARADPNLRARMDVLISIPGISTV